MGRTIRDDAWQIESARNVPNDGMSNKVGGIGPVNPGFKPIDNTKSLDNNPSSDGSVPVS